MRDYIIEVRIYPDGSVMANELRIKPYSFEYGQTIPADAGVSSAGAELTTEALDTQAKIEQAYQDGWRECEQAIRAAEPERNPFNLTERDEWAYRLGYESGVKDTQRSIRPSAPGPATPEYAKWPNRTWDEDSEGVSTRKGESREGVRPVASNAPVSNPSESSSDVGKDACLLCGVLHPHMHRWDGKQDWIEPYPSTPSAERESLLPKAVSLLSQARMAMDSPASLEDWWGDVTELLREYVRRGEALPSQGDTA